MRPLANITTQQLHLVKNKWITAETITTSHEWKTMAVITIKIWNKHQARLDSFDVKSRNPKMKKNFTFKQKDIVIPLKAVHRMSLASFFPSSC